MDTKLYRVKKSLAKLAKDRRIIFIQEEGDVVTEAEIINAAIEKGLKEISNKDIKETTEKYNKN